MLFAVETSMIWRPFNFAKSIPTELSTRIVTIQKLRYENSAALAIKQKSIRAAESGLIAGIGQQHQAQVVISQQRKLITTLPPLFPFFVRERARAAMNFA